MKKLFTISFVILSLTIILLGCVEKKENYVIANVTCMVNVKLKIPFEGDVAYQDLEGVMINVEINKAGGERVTDIIYPQVSSIGEDPPGKTSCSASFRVYKEQPLYFIGNIVLQSVPSQYSDFTFYSDIEKIEWSEIYSEFLTDGLFTRIVYLTITGTHPDLIEE